MKTVKVREIIVEFERVQLIRKKAKTHLNLCGGCQSEGDFLSLREAASLFSTDAAELFRFIKTNFSHYQTDAGGEIFICLNSLLACMKAKTNHYQLKGDKNNDRI